MSSSNPQKHGGTLLGKHSPRHSKPAGRGHVPQSTNPSSDYGVPPLPVYIVRYGPNSTKTDTPSSRVATGLIPQTGGGLKRYTATVDGTTHGVDICRAGKWEHGDGAFFQAHSNQEFGRGGRSQTPKQVRLTRTGKKTGD
jgi:hypothetical protein